MEMTEQPQSGLVCKQVDVRIDRKAVVKSCSFAIFSSELVALIGPNGAGKSSLLRALAHLVPFDGELTYRNKPIRNMTRHERARTIAYMPQSGRIHWPISVRNVVALGRIPFGLDVERLDETSLRYVVEAMELCGVAHLADRNAQSLSGGEQSRVLLARALATKADVLLVDEPTSGLDPRHQIAAMSALREYARSGRIVVSATHDIDLAVQYADRFILMDGGSICGDGGIDDLYATNSLQRAYGVGFDLTSGPSGRSLRIRTNRPDN